MIRSLNLFHLLQKILYFMRQAVHFVANQLHIPRLHQNTPLQMITIFLLFHLTFPFLCSVSKDFISFFHFLKLIFMFDLEALFFHLFPVSKAFEFNLFLQSFSPMFSLIFPYLHLLFQTFIV